MLNSILVSLALFTPSIEKGDTYQADIEQSDIKWTASKIVGSTHNGTLQLSDGTLEISKGKLVGGAFILDMTTIANTDVEGEWKAKLEGHLKSDDFFAVEKYKTATLTITNVKPTGNNKYDVTADITIKGITESITFPATVSSTKGEVTATAMLAIDRTKFGVRYGSPSFFDDLGDKAISNEFTIEINLIATK